ncbi:MAG: hypothetical protein ACLQO1_22550 [Steroidobacteraceae bacterium]
MTSIRPFALSFATPLGVCPLYSHRGPHSLDRQVHDSIAKGTAKKSMVLRKANRIVIG